MAHRVDAPGDVVDEEHPHQPAPEVAGERADPGAGDRVTERRRDQQADHDQGDEVAGDEAHAVVLVEVLRVFLPVGAALGLHQPAGVGVPETAQPLAVSDVGTVWVALLVGVGVVLAVVGDPGEDGTLHRHRAEHGEGVFEPLRGLEGTVGEQAVIADRDPDRGDQVHEGGDREDAGADQAPGRRTIATIVATKGTTTPARFAAFSILVISPIETKLRLPGRYVLASEPSSGGQTCQSDAKNSRLHSIDDPWRGLPARVADLIEGEIDPIAVEILAVDRPRSAGVRAAAGGALRPRDPARGGGGAGPVRRPDPRSRRGARLRPRGLPGPRPRRAAGGPHPRLAAGGLPDRRPGGLAALRRRLPPRTGSAPRRWRCSPRRSSPTSTSSPPTRSRASRRPRPRSRTCAGGAVASWSRCCSPTRPPTPATSPRRRAPRPGTCPPAWRRSPARRRRWRGWRGGCPPRRWRRWSTAKAACCCPTPRAPAAPKRWPAPRKRRARARPDGHAGGAASPGRWRWRSVTPTGGRGPDRGDGDRPVVAASRASTRAGRRARAAAATARRRGDARLRSASTSNLAALLLYESRDLAGRIAARRLAPLADLTPKARARMRETALAHLRHDGNAVAMAAEMHVHPQTARYRIARLRELLGDQLDDPDARFELQLALRAGAVRGLGGGRRRGRGAARPRPRASRRGRSELKPVWLAKVWIRPGWRRIATRTPQSRIVSAYASPSSRSGSKPAVAT